MRLIRSPKILLPLLFIVLASCSAVKPYVDRGYQNWMGNPPPPESEIKHSIYFIGDAGDPSKDGREPAFRFLESMLYTSIDTVITPGDSLNGIAADTVINYKSNTQDAIVWLGDNIYYAGLPPETDNAYPDKTWVLREQVDVMKNFTGRKFFV